MIVALVKETLGSHWLLLSEVLIIEYEGPTRFYPRMQFPGRCNVLFHTGLIKNSKKEIVKRRIRFLLKSKSY